MNQLFVIVFLMCIGSAMSAETVIRLGQSCALAGPTQILGIQMNRGLMAAFHEVNTTDALRGIKIDLIALNDIYEPTFATNNTIDLIQNYGVFGIVGVVGTPNSQSSITALDSVGSSSTPFVGAYSGANPLLRSPFRDNVINVRASFFDETAAIVKFLLSKQITRISILYQLDSFGLSGLEGLNIALTATGLKLESSSNYTRNTLNVEPGIDEIFTGHTVQALVMVGAYNPLAKAVGYARSTYFATSVLFFTISFVNPEYFSQGLINYGQSFDNIYVSQVVPPPLDTSFSIVRQYQTALSAFDPAATPNFVSLEGYLVGQFVIEVLARIRGPITPANFLQTIYNSSIFFLGGMTLGPYDNGFASPCNQGMSQVFLTTIQSDGNYTLVPDFNFRWDGCKASNSLPNKRIKWGQTCAMSGPSSDLGIEMNRGILTAFAESNDADALHGAFLDLVTLDDKYDTTPAYINTKELITNHQVFGLIGSVGTPISQQIVNAMNELGSTIPLVGAYTGAKFLRLPFTRNIINVRASYIDETAAMVNWLRNNLVSRVSIFYQNDAFGLAGYEGLSLALNASGMPLASEGIYTRNTLDIEEGMTQVLSKYTEAIVMIGAYAPLARAIEFGRNYSTIGASAYYLTVSFVGADSFRQQLVDRGQDFRKIFVTQVVPPPRDKTDPLVVRYQEALAKYHPGATPNFVSLEGYLAGLLAIETTARIAGRNYTSSNFLDALYLTELFAIGKHKVGPYIDSAASSTLNCNQGLRKVWFTEIYSDGNYTVVPGSDFSWEGTCLSATSDLVRPIVFGQSAALSGPTSSLGLNMRAGILAAFNRFNRQGGLEGRPVKLLTYDDGYEPNRTSPNIQQLIENGIIGLIGVTGASASNAAVNKSIPAMIPFIAPYTGSTYFMRSSLSKYVINTRASYQDETAAIVSWLVDAKFASARSNRTFSNIGVFYQNDTYGSDGRESVIKALAYHKMSIVAEGLYPRNTLDVENGLFGMTRSANNIDAVIMIGAYAPCAKFVKLGKAAFPPTTVYFGVSFMGAEYFAEQLKLEGVQITDATGNLTIYVSHALPPSTDYSHPLVAEYVEEIALLTPPQVPNSIALEGYLAGRFAMRVLQLCALSGEVSPQSFVDSVFKYSTFDMKTYKLGPYTLNATSNDALCNQGSHQVWIIAVAGDYQIVPQPDFEFVFDTCGVNLNINDEAPLEIPPIAAPFAEAPLEAANSASNPVGPIVGAFFGGLITLALIAAIVFLILIRRRSSKKQLKGQHSPDGNESESKLIEPEAKPEEKSKDEEYASLSTIEAGLNNSPTAAPAPEAAKNSGSNAPVYSGVVVDDSVNTNTTKKPKKSKTAKEKPAPPPANSVEMQEVKPETSAAVSNEAFAEFKPEWMISFSDLKFQTKLGQGAFGTVFKGKWRGSNVAIKQSTVLSVDQSAMQDFKREALLMLQLQPHPNCVQMLGICVENTNVYVVMELCNRGSLDALIKAGGVTLERKLRIIAGIAAGVWNLHHNGIVHRDLAARNILLGTEDVAKVSDFGMARIVDQFERQGVTSSNVGPIRWMAPEAIQRRIYSPKSDVWSWANTVVEILNEKEPYHNMSLAQIIPAIASRAMRPPLTAECPDWLLELLDRCWSIWPEERPSMEEITEIMDSHVL